MITKMRMAIDESKVGFKRFLKSQIMTIRNRLYVYDHTPYSCITLDEYAEAVKLNDLFEQFMSKLNDEEKAVVKYINYHSPNEKQPSNYIHLINPIYEIWHETFYDCNAYLKGINKYRMSKVMRYIRVKHHVNILQLARLLNVNRCTITLYEEGYRFPKLDYLYRFCCLFSLTLNDFVELTLNTSLAKEKEKQPLI